jgi:uncharacterized membrane protein YkvA (DUF1232 family)
MDRETAHALEIYDPPRAERHYTRLRKQVSAWLERHHASPRTQRYLLLIPDLFALVLRLLADPRLDLSLKAQLVVVAAYVIAPFDLIPDFIMPVGLTDDTIALAFVLSRVVALMGQAGESLLQQYWEGDGEALQAIQKVLAGADGIIDRLVRRRIRKRFG